MNSLLKMVVWTAVVGTAAAPKARAIFGVGDVSFVTVVANPAEAANWASQIEALGEQLSKLQQTESQIEVIRSQAGDPAAAVALGSNLAGLLSQSSALVGLPSTASAITAVSQANPTAALEAVGAGTTMQVLGQTQSRNLSLYSSASQASADLVTLRSQIASEQTARTATETALAEAWSEFRGASTESEKQAALTRIEQLHATSSLLADRRSALLDDEALSRKQADTGASVKATADDEQWVAQGTAIAALERTRAQAAETQRLNVINATVPAPNTADYSSLQLWMPADAQSSSP